MGFDYGPGQLIKIDTEVDISLFRFFIEPLMDQAHAENF
jgi:hypothetical protein